MRGAGRTTSKAVPARKERILLADDDTAVSSMVRHDLEADGYEVHTCESGLEALESILSKMPDLAVLDHFMPGLTGAEVCMRLRALGSPIRLILLTTHSGLEARVAGLDAGADDYLGKPFEMAELKARIRAQLRTVVPGPQGAPSEAALKALVQGLRSSDATVRKLARKSVQRFEGGLEFRVLGSFEVRWHGMEMANAIWNRRIPRTLLKLLLLNHGNTVSREWLQETLWPEQASSSVSHNLTMAMQRLREGLGMFPGDRLLTVEGGYMFRLQEQDRLDLQEFEHGLEVLTHAQGSGIHQLLQVIPRLVDLYTGDLFAEEPCAEWATARRESLRGQFLDVLVQAVTLHRAQGFNLEACMLLRRLVELEPTEERYSMSLAECLEATGDTPRAVEVLIRLEEVLRTELDVEPSAACLALRRRLAVKPPQAL